MPCLGVRDVDYEFLALLVVPFLRGVWLLVGYLSGNAFPQPLSPGEEAKYLARLKQGDPRARQVLIERNLRLVAHIVKTNGSNTQTRRAEARRVCGLIGVSCADDLTGSALGSGRAADGIRCGGPSRCPMARGSGQRCGC